MDKDKIKQFFSGERIIRIVIFLGLAGMALILLSHFMGDKTSGTVDTRAATFTADNYAEQLELKLTELITGIDGVGEARIMVTLETGVEYVWAQEEKRNTDRTHEGTADENSGGRVHEKENVEQTYILVDSAGGKRQPLLQMELQPKVQGVIIVCEGADDVRVQHNLVNVVTTALNIPSTRVYVVKIDSGTKEIN